MPRNLVVLILAIAAVLTTSCKEVLIPPAPDHPSSEQGIAISSDGVSVRYDVHGNGNPTLIFIHGWSCDRSYWDAQVEHFRDDYRVVTVDLGGHGKSSLDRENWTMEAFGEDVAAVARQVDANDVVLIGHSMGGAVMIEAARNLPGKVRVLVAADTLHDVEEVITDGQMEAFLAPLRANFSLGTHNMVRTHLFNDNADPRLVSQVASNMASAPPSVALSAVRNLFEYDAASALDTVQCPVRCIDCGLYPINVEAGSRHTPSYKAVVMPKVGHFLMMEDPAGFNRELERILEEFRKS